MRRVDLVAAAAAMEDDGENSEDVVQIIKMMDSVIRDLDTFNNVDVAA